VKHFFFLVFLLTGCASTEVRLGELFQLQQDRSVSVDGATIKLIGVGPDSRCRPGMQCVWEGDAEVRIRVNGVEATLHTHGGNRYPRSRTVAGYNVTLRDLTFERPFVASLVVERVPETR
jgi:hypothetical protein